MIIRAQTLEKHRFCASLLAHKSARRTSTRQTRLPGGKRCRPKEMFFSRNWYHRPNTRKMPKLLPHILYQVLCHSCFVLLGMKLRWSVVPEGHNDFRQSRQQRQERERFRDEGAFMYYVPRRDLSLSIAQKRGDQLHLSSYYELKYIQDPHSQLQISQPRSSQRAERTMLQRTINCVFQGRLVSNIHHRGMAHRKHDRSSFGF
jgi:hypothetical protein